MLESVFIMLLIFAILLMLLFIAWESIIIGLIDVFLWFLLALGIYDIEVPYQYTSSGVVYTATQHIQTMYPLWLLFFMIGIVLLLFLVSMCFEAWKDKELKVL